MAACRSFFLLAFGAILVAGFSGIPGRPGGARHPIRVSQTRVSFRARPVAVDDSSCVQQPGLLNGGTNGFYTSSLFKDDDDLDGFKENLKIYTERGGFWRVAERCAERNGTETEAYVAEIYRKAREFIKSNELEDRDELLAQIRHACTSEGISMLLGGKSTGKSFIAESVMAELNKEESSFFVVLADLRGSADLFAAVESALRGELLRKLAKNWIFKLIRGIGSWIVEPIVRHWKKIIVRSVQSPTSGPFAGIAEAVLEGIDVKKGDAPTLIEKFVNVSRQHNIAPVLMIDEANLLATATEEQTALNKQIVGKLVKLTKQKNALSVVLISSDYAFPFLLQEKLAFDLTDLRRTIFAGELPPDRMRKLLAEWGMDAELVKFCIGVYGGHVYDTFRAIEEHVFRKDDMSAFDVEPLDASMNIMCCLEAENGDDQSLREIKKTVPEIAKGNDLAGVTLAGLKDTLRELAATGFVPLKKPYDDKARILSKYNIAAVVDKKSFVFGLDNSLWDTTPQFKSALVPSSQFMRMIIARELNDSGNLEK